MNRIGVHKAITNLRPRDDFITAPDEGLQAAREQIRKMRDDYARERHSNFQLHLQKRSILSKEAKRHLEIAMQAQKAFELVNGLTSGPSDALLNMLKSDDAASGQRG